MPPSGPMPATRDAAASDEILSAMMLIAIAYLACAAFVLTHLGRAPHIEDDDLPDEVRHDEQESEKARGGARKEKGRRSDRTPSTPAVRSTPRP